MKKKPELLKRTGKSSLTLRNFLNNLKENDLHFENKQITQCVFLGVLRLKPVPSIFSKNNVPSVSAPAGNTKSKRIKNNNTNKAPNKNPLKKNDINKVLGGKVSKKNPQKVKAAVKEVPDKKATFKIKLHTNKKISKIKKNVHPSSKEKKVALKDSPESSQTCDPVLSTSTVGLNPLTSPAKFNPVQNLFNKLKQKVDLTHGEPEPSTNPKQTNNTLDNPGPSGVNSKVCKINAKTQINPSINANRKSKKSIQRKSVNCGHLVMPLEPTSPITISDSDSTSKKDDVIIISQDEEEINVEKRPPTEDVIFVNEVLKPVKPKERTSPRNKTISVHDKEATTDNFEKHGVIVINDELKLTKQRSPVNPKDSTQTFAEVTEKEPSDIIIISDEPKTKEITQPSTSKGQEHSKNDVIFIDEVRELRVSPRTKNMEAAQEKLNGVPLSNTNLQGQETGIDKVFVITEKTNRTPKTNKTHGARNKMEHFSEKSSRDQLKMQQLNITIDDHIVKSKEKVSPILLKIVNNNDSDMSLAVRKELLEKNEAEVIIVNEKPKQRKPKLKPALIPPMFLNAPMLLRSELAPKKTSSTFPERPKRKERMKLLRSDMEHTKNLKNSHVELNEKNVHITDSEYSNISEPQNKNLRLLNEYSNTKKINNDLTVLHPSQTSSDTEDIIFVADHTRKSKGKSLSIMSRSRRPEKSIGKVKQTDIQEIDLVTEVGNLMPDSLNKSDIVGVTPEPSNSNVQENKIKGILNEEQTLTEKLLISSRHLRSELDALESSTKKSKLNKEHTAKPRQKSSKNAMELLDENIKEDISATEKISHRLLRSELTKQKNLERSLIDNVEALIKKEHVLQNESLSPTVIEISSQAKSNNFINEVEILNQQEDLVNKQLGSDKQPDIQCIEEFLDNEEIVIVKDDPIQKNISTSSDITEPINVESCEQNKTEEVLVMTKGKVALQTETNLPRLLRSEIVHQKIKPKSPQKKKQIDLDEIIVVNEKPTKKKKERTISGRLLRSELALQKSKKLLQVKTEVEEVVVLIHDEPKPKQKSSPENETLQMNDKRVNIQEVIILADDPYPSKNASPGSLRSDTSQNYSLEKTSPNAEPLISGEIIQDRTKTERRRLLRSEQNVSNLLKGESRNRLEANAEKQILLRSAMARFQDEIIVLSEEPLLSQDAPPSSLQADTGQNHRPDKISPNTESLISDDIIQEKTKVDRRRLLRSEENVSILPKEKSKTPVRPNCENENLPRSETARIKEEVIVLAEEPPLSDNTLPRSLRSGTDNIQERTKIARRRLLRSEQNVSNEESNNAVEANITKKNLIKSETANIRQEVIVPSEKPQPSKKASPKSLRSDIGQKQIPDKISLNTEFLPSNDIQEKAKTEKHRILRSEQNFSNSLIEESKNSLGANGENQNLLRSQTSKIQEEVIVLAEEPLTSQNTSPRSLRSDMGQKQSPKKTPPSVKPQLLNDMPEKTQVEKHRLLRSEQNIPNLLKEELKNSFDSNIENQNLFRSETTKKCLQVLPKDQLGSSEIAVVKKIQSQTSSARSLKSVAAQSSGSLLMKESTNSSAANTEKQKSLSSEITSRKSSRTKDHTDTIDLEEVDMKEPPRLLRSQHSPRNLLEEPAILVETQKLLKSKITKKASPTMPINQPDNCDKKKEQMENISSPRLLRSIASQSLPEHDTTIKTKVKKRLLKSEIISSEVSTDMSRDLDLSATCDVVEEKAMNDPYPPMENFEDMPRQQLANAQTREKSPAVEQIDMTEVIIDENIGKQYGPRLLRSEMSLQKKSNQLSDSTDSAGKIADSCITARKSLSEPPTTVETVELEVVKQRRPRKTRSLLIDFKTKLKTPMLLRSELAQLKNPITGTSKQVKGLKQRKKRGRQPKLTPSPSTGEIVVQELSPTVQIFNGDTSNQEQELKMKERQPKVTSPNVEVSVQQLSANGEMHNGDAANQKQELKRKGYQPKVISPSNIEIPPQQISPNLQLGKVKIPKRKSLIDDLKRKKSAQQKMIAMQSSREVVLEPKIIPEEHSENLNVTNESIRGTIDNILPNNIEIERENSMQTTLKSKLKRKKSPKQKASAVQSSPEVVSSPKTISEELSENKIVINASSTETVANILSNNVEIERENSIQTKFTSKLKGKKSPKQKAIVVQGSPEVVSNSKTISEELSEHKIVINESSSETGANILSSNVKTERENSTQIPLQSKLKRRMSPKQKAITVQSSPEVISGPKTVSEGLSENQNVINEINRETIVNILYNNAEIEREDSKQAALKCKLKTKKLSKQKAIALQSSTEVVSRCKTIAEELLENQNIINGTSTETVANDIEREKSTTAVVKGKLKRKKSSKQQAISVQSSLEVVSNPKTIELPENQNVITESSTETVANEVERENSTTRVVKRKLKRNMSSKRKTISVQSSLEVVSDSKILSAELPENQNIITKSSTETVANILSRNAENERENSKLIVLKGQVKRTKLTKRKATVVPVRNNLEVDSEPKTISEELTENKIVINETTPETVANILPTNIKTDKINSSQIALKSNVKRKKLPKQQATTMQSHPEVILEPETISDDLSEIHENTMKTAAINLPSYIETEKELKCKSKNKPKKKDKNDTSETLSGKHRAQDALKRISLEKAIEDKLPDAPKSKSKKTVKENSSIDLTGNLKAQDPPKSINSKAVTLGQTPIKCPVKRKAKIQNGTKNEIDIKEISQAPPKRVLSKKIVEENPGEKRSINPVKRKTNIQNGSKSVTPKVDIQGSTQENATEKSNNKALNTPISIKSKKKVEENSTINPLKRKSNSSDLSKKVNPKHTKNVNTLTKLATAKSSQKEIGPPASENTSPNQRIKPAAKRKLKVTKAVESCTAPKSPVSIQKVPEEVKTNQTPEKSPKKIDTTIYDFVESEPEVILLRLHSPKKVKTVASEITKEVTSSKSNGDVTPKPKRLKLMANKTIKDDPKTKAEAKAKLIAMLGDKSPQNDNPESPEKPMGKRTKTKCTSKTGTDKEQSLDTSLSSPKQAENTKKDKKNPAPDKSNTSPVKTNNSPMKQTTITEMFSKVFVKQENANGTEPVFNPVPRETCPEEPLKETTNENTMTNMGPPKVEKNIIPFTKNEGEENGLFEDDDDDDSDCESRVEWMPDEYAEYKFKYSAKMMMNYKTVHRCKICLLILPTYYRLCKHKKEHIQVPNPYNCTQCDQAFPNIEELTAHLRIHKGKHPYACKKCDIGFWSKKSLDAHTPIHVLRKMKQANKRFRCDVCAREFSKLCDMERHTRVHTGEKPCVCNICNKRFQQSHNLSKHLLTHLHVKPYHCEICNKQFGRNDVLNRHLLTHSVDKPIKCPLCPKGFIRQTQLNNHMNKTHPDEARVDTMTEIDTVEEVDTTAEDNTVMAEFDTMPKADRLTGVNTTEIDTVTEIVDENN